MTVCLLETFENYQCIYPIAPKYSYLGAVPLLLVYSIGMTVIKVREGA